LDLAFSSQLVHFGTRLFCKSISNNVLGFYPGYSIGVGIHSLAFAHDRAWYIGARIDQWFGLHDRVRLVYVVSIVI